MKKFLCIVFFMAFCNISFAQYVRQGSTITVNGERQDKAATIAMLNRVGGSDMAEQWNAAASKRGLGIGLTAGGFTVAAVGAALSLGGAIAGGLVGGTIGGIAGDAQGGADAGVKAMSPVTTAGLIAAGAGVAAGVVGIVQLSSSKKVMDAIVNKCNNTHASTLSLEATPYGVGLAYRF